MVAFWESFFSRCDPHEGPQLRLSERLLRRAGPLARENESVSNTMERDNKIKLNIAHTSAFTKNRTLI